jgi:uncharacterized protein
MIAVALSGGVDSSLLLSLLVKELGRDKVVAFVGCSPIRKRESIEMAFRICNILNVKCFLISLYEYLLQDFFVNKEDRCYVCKKHLYSRFIEFGKKLGIEYIYDGSNKDDLEEDRPGILALKELGIKAPLLNLEKKEIRKYAKRLQLPNWDLPSDSCLATRIERGIHIDIEKLFMIYRAEKIVQKFVGDKIKLRVLLSYNSMGIVRLPSDILKSISPYMHIVEKELKHIGFSEVVYEAL